MDMADPEVQDFIALLEKEFNAAVKTLKEQHKGKKIKEASIPYTLLEGDDEGKVRVSFKCRARIEPKDKDPFDFKPALFDAKLKPINSNIGGGSTLKVAFEAIPYYTALVGAGITLRLKAVQVLDLKEYSGASGASYGFDEEDGYAREEEYPEYPPEDDEVDGSADF